MKRTRKPKPTIACLQREVESLKESLARERNARQKLESSDYKQRMDLKDNEKAMRDRDHELDRLRPMMDEMSRVHGLLDLLDEAPPRTLEEVFSKGEPLPRSRAFGYPTPPDIPAATRLAAWLARRHR